MRKIIAPCVTCVHASFDEPFDVLIHSLVREHAHGLCTANPEVTFKLVKSTVTKEDPRRITVYIDDKPRKPSERRFVKHCIMYKKR